MKRIIKYSVLCLLLLCLTACRGNVSHVNIVQVDSSMYTHEEINEGIDVIKEYFHEHFDNCMLKEIQYATDEKSLEYKEWASRHNADEVMVFISDYYVGNSGGDGSLNPNSTYEDWMWILVREKGGKWRHVDHGYG